MQPTKKSVVGLIRGDDRYDNVRRALEAISETVDLHAVRRPLIKPNFVSTTRQLAATHVDAVRAVLDFLRERGVGHVDIAEHAAGESTMEGYRNYGYLSLCDEYDVELIDLAQEDWVDGFVYDDSLARLPVKLARRIVESDFRVSVNPIKTHNCVVVTLSIKNMAIGALKDRSPFHHGWSAMHRSLEALGQLTAPHLAVLDGFEGMEGDGPCSGDPVDLRVAIASTDPVAADATGARVMEHDLEQIDYIAHCQRGGLGEWDATRIELRGNVSLKEASRPFCKHPRLTEQSG
jgi:uncharacterized protein (DUF362 family)